MVDCISKPIEYELVNNGSVDLTPTNAESAGRAQEVKQQQVWDEAARMDELRAKAMQSSTMGQRRTKDARKTRNKGESQVSKHPIPSVFKVEARSYYSKESEPKRSNKSNEMNDKASKSLRLKQGRPAKQKVVAGNFSLSSSQILAELRSDSRRKIEPYQKSYG